MGLALARLQLGNVRPPDRGGIEGASWANTGALALCAAEHAVHPELRKRNVTIAHGTRTPEPYSGPVGVILANRWRVMRTLLWDAEPVDGSIGIDDADIVIAPATRDASVNPPTLISPLRLPKPPIPETAPALGRRPKPARSLYVPSRC